MGSANTPAQIRQMLRNSDGPTQKIKHKPKKFNPTKDLRNSDKNKFKESFGGEGV
jgi:hypothetical protein